MKYFYLIHNMNEKHYAAKSYAIALEMAEHDYPDFEIQLINIDYDDIPEGVKINHALS